MFMSSLRDKFTLLLQNSVRDVSVVSLSAMLVPIQVSTSMASPYKFYKFR